MVKVSIIVPVYNVEKYLEQCLDSLTKQTLRDIEIICINDGSKDSSLSILRKYENNDKRIKIIDKKNEGQSVARNIGIKMAQGEYLGFVDSDDWVDLDYFEKLYNTAVKYNCDIACAGFKRYKKQRSSCKKSFKREVVIGDIQSKINTDRIPIHNYLWNKIYKRETFLKTGLFFPEGRVYEDIAILAQILYLMGDMVTVPDTYYNYRQNPNSTIATRTEKNREDYENAMKELFDFAKNHNIILDARRNIIRKEYIKLFNITILKIYYCRGITQYKLFGFIPFVEKN